MAAVSADKGHKTAKTKAPPPKPKPQSKAARNAANGGQVKTKRTSNPSTSSLREKSKKRKQRTYSDKELGLPTLNMITPAGVVKQRGKKKGKVFVDDAASMRTILALVSADREGQIESKMQKARQMEEIREARRAEMEEKEQSKKKKLEDVKDGLRKKKTRKAQSAGESAEDSKILRGVGKKRVAFG